MSTGLSGVLERASSRAKLGAVYEQAMLKIGVPKSDPVYRVGEFFSKAGAMLPGATGSAEKINAFVENTGDLDTESRKHMVVAAAMAASGEEQALKLLPSVATMCKADVSPLQDIFSGKSPLAERYATQDGIDLDL